MASMICSNCHHDMSMYEDGNYFCFECGFKGIGYCEDAWQRMMQVYHIEPDD